MGVRSSCDMLARNSLLAWLAASAVRMAFSKSSVRWRMRSSRRSLMLADFFLGGVHFRDHAVEAFAQIFDFVAGGADLDGFEFAFADGRDTLLQKRERAAQGAHGKARNDTGDDHQKRRSSTRLAASRKCGGGHPTRMISMTIHTNSKTMKRENLDDSERKLAGLDSPTYPWCPFPRLSTIGKTP